jgi:D-aspartate ligase
MFSGILEKAKGGKSSMKNCKESTGVIVIGDHVQALGIIRSLGRHGIPVYLLHDTTLCISRFSRYCTKFIKTPSIDNESDFISFLVDLAKKIDLTDYILMPTNDAAVKILSMNKDILEEYYKVPTPHRDITKFALNKDLTYSLAAEIGIPVPETIHPRNVEELQKLDVNYPVILKGVAGLDFYRKTGVKAFRATSMDELKSIYENISNLIDISETLIQEEIPGGTDRMYSFCSFFKNDELLGVWTGRKVRERPMGLGTGTFAESIYVPEIVELGSKMLSAMHYYGISEIEFKKDPRDNKFKLIEMNARTWLWVSLAARAGVNFPYILYMDMIGDGIAPVESFEGGIWWMHIYTDLGVMIKEVSRRNMRIRDYFTSLNNCDKEFAVFSLNDPVPFIMETLMLPYLWKTR